MLKIHGIVDGPATNTIVNYTSNVDTIDASNSNCSETYITGYHQSDYPYGKRVRLITHKDGNTQVWSSSPGQIMEGMVGSFSTEEGWDSCYITRNSSCSGDDTNDHTGYKLYDIQLGATDEYQLYYPNQVIEFGLYKLNEDTTENLIGTLEFNSTESVEGGWWSPSKVSWDRPNYFIETPTPIYTPTPFMGQPEYTPTPSELVVYNLEPWVTVNSATLNIVNGEIDNILFNI